MGCGARSRFTHSHPYSSGESHGIICYFEVIVDQLNELRLWWDSAGSKAEQYGLLRSGNCKILVPYIVL